MYLYSVAHFAHWTHLSRVGVTDITDDDGDAMAMPSADELGRFIAQELSRVSPASARWE